MEKQINTFKDNLDAGKYSKRAKELRTISFPHIGSKVNHSELIELIAVADEIKHSAENYISYLKKVIDDLPNQ